MIQEKEMYSRIWTFIRQNSIRALLTAEDAIYKISGGKKPASEFCLRADPHKIDTDVKIIRSSSYSTDIAKFNPDGSISDNDFVIVTTTDFHFEDDNEENSKSFDRFFRQLEEIRPDLVILTGDIIVTKYQQIDALRFARAMEKIGIYWTAVFGNHEVREEKGFYKYLLLKNFADYPHCLCKFGPDEMYGYGNHTINIIGSGNTLRQTLFMFDSGRDIRDRLRREYNIPDDMNGYDFLKKEQIDFYKNEIDRLKATYGEFNSMMYMHIPLKEYEHVFKGNEKDGYIPSGECEILYGEQYESIGSSPFNSGMFDAILEKGSTKAVFAGHDHVNDWCAVYKGIYLVYSLHGGYSPYHMGHKTDKPESEWVQGVTVTTLHGGEIASIRPSYNRKYLEK